MYIKDQIDFLFTLLSFIVDKEQKKNKEDTLQIGEEVKVNYKHIYTKLN